MPRYLIFFPFLCYVLLRPHIPATNAVRLSSDFLSCTFLEEETPLLFHFKGCHSEPHL